MGGFPTIYFFPGKDKKSPVLYGGARETEDLATFIMEKVRHVYLEKIMCELIPKRLRFAFSTLKNDWFRNGHPDFVLGFIRE